MTSARPRWGRSGPGGDPDAPLVRARQRGEPHPPKNNRGGSVSAAWRPGELLIDCEEDCYLRAVLVGMLWSASSDRPDPLADG